MGKYLNPGNDGFAEAISTYYVDKTDMLGVINRSINTKKKLICISRPRRFGKSYAAQMICAYYDCTCDSHLLFNKYKISKDDTFDIHLNKYNVIYLDIASFISDYMQQNDSKDIIKNIAESIKKDIIAELPELSNDTSINDCILKYVEKSKKKFVFIIDEWDAIIRESENNIFAKQSYLHLLRSWFKNGNFTTKAIAAAYMTGILPIKKDGSQSAISDFEEYSVIDPGVFADFSGFTENEVQRLCAEYQMDYEQIKEWYDGYTFGKATSIYNPYSVIKAIDRKIVKSYWRKTSAAESLITYVNLGGDELQEKIARLISGEAIKVYTDDFENDIETFKSDDDVLTLLIHLGYLTFDEKTSLARIPNTEVQEEFGRILKKAQNRKLVNLVKMSEKLLSDTLTGNEIEVANAIQNVRETNYAPMFYNDEQALRYAVKFAYIICEDRYTRIEELPSGRGLADIVYLPDQGERLPALIIELKWNKTDESALAQIKNHKYPAALNKYTGNIILVGINYDEKTKKHSCKIETIVK